MRTGIALLSLSLAACIGLPASIALAQTVPDAEPLFVQPEHSGCGKCCFPHDAADPDAWQPGQLVPGFRFGVRGPGGDPTDVLNNNLAIEVNPPNAAMTGSNLMTIRSNASGLTTFTFMLRTQYAVSLCRVTDSVGFYDVVPAGPVAGSYARTITFVRPIPMGEVFTIRIDYSGNFVAGIGLGSLFMGYQTTASSPPVICTLSEPYYSATWWPCKDGDVFQPGDNSDKATLDFAITAPDTFQSVANGTLVGVDTLPDSRKRYRWSASTPMSTYLVCFSTTQYNQWSVNYTYGPGQTMPVEFSIYPGYDNGTNRLAWEKTLVMMDTFRSVYGLYPFINEKYGIYQFQFNGGMEHQTHTGQGGTGAFNEGLTAHELAHQWWGDNVTCKTWSDIWLNEGFATYSECLWEERKPGALTSGLTTCMLAKKPSTQNINASNSYVYIPPGEVNNASRIFSQAYSYQKGGWVLHMLRHVMGDAAFFNGLMAYRAAYEHSAATTADFIAIMQGVHGSNLAWFFGPWLYEPGAPTYAFGWASTNINGQDYLRLNVAQTQTGSAPLFDMPMDVRIQTSAGTVNAIARVHATTNDFLIPIPGTPSSVQIDPDAWILNYGKNSLTYVQGPPKVVSTSISPGASIALASAPTTLQIVLSDPVNIAPTNVAVTRSAAPVPFTLAYSAASLTATLTFASPLTAGAYNVTISDDVTAVANGQRLDGELASNTAGALPSGNGVAEGTSLFSFTITAPPCAADFNHDSNATVADIFAFLTAWFAGDTAADFDHAGGVNVSDIFAFLTAWFAGCP